MRRIAAALLLASLLTGRLDSAGCAHAPAAEPLQTGAGGPPPGRARALANATLLAGVALVAASFPLADAADRRYDEYLAESDPQAIEARWRRVTRADRVAAASLLAGEALLVTGVWLRFVRQPPEARVRFAATPTRCAVTLRF